MLLLGSLGTTTPVLAASVDDMRSQGKEAFENEEYEKAKEIFEQIIAEGTDTYYENWYLGNITSKMNYDFTASDYYEKAWEQLEFEDVNATGMVTNWMNAMYNQGVYWYVEQIYEEAKEAYESGYEKCQKEDFYLTCMESFYLDRNQMTVQEFVDTYLQNKSSLEIAEFLNSNGYYKEAISYYEKAQSEEPANITYLNRLGGIYCDKLGRYEEALSMWDTCRSLTSGMMSFDVASGRAYCYKAMGDSENAITYYVSSFEHVKTASQVTFFFDTNMEAGYPERAKAELDQFVADGGEETDVASLYMMWAG